MTRISARKKVCIVGAGPGGLANAMLMAQAGADVTVFEREDRVGGRCAAIEAEGFRFDTVPTFFLYRECSKKSSSPSARSLARRTHDPTRSAVSSGIRHRWPNRCDARSGTHASGNGRIALGMRIPLPAS